MYSATQPQVGREVAIKIFSPEFVNDVPFFDRFKTITQTVAGLEFPWIVPLYDYWRDPSGAYLVMRWLRGGSLENLLAQGPCPLPTAVTVLDQISNALSTAHQQGVIHRDLKPGNIILDADGEQVANAGGELPINDVDRRIASLEPGNAPELRDIVVDDEDIRMITDHIRGGGAVQVGRSLEEMDDVLVFHAATTRDDDGMVTNGGRVLGVTALGDTVEAAIDKAYKAVEKISWSKVHYRRDIGKKALIRMQAVPQVGIVMGSDSDLKVMEGALGIFKKFGIPIEMTVASAHRSPQRAAAYATSARERGLKAIIAGAGHAAHVAVLLEHEHAFARIIRKLSGHDAPGRAPADHDVIVVAHHCLRPKSLRKPRHRWARPLP